MKKTVAFKKTPHKKGCSTKTGNSKYTQKLPLTEFHSLKKTSPEEIRPLHKDHWELVARFKHQELYEYFPKWRARTSGSWRPFKFAVRLSVVTQHYLTVEHDYT